MQMFIVMIIANFDLDKNREFYIPHNSNEQGNNILDQKITCTQVAKKNNHNLGSNGVM